MMCSCDQLRKLVANVWRMILEPLFSDANGHAPKHLRAENNAYFFKILIPYFIYLPFFFLYSNLAGWFAVVWQTQNTHLKWTLH